MLQTPAGIAAPKQDKKNKSVAALLPWVSRLRPTLVQFLSGTEETDNCSSFPTPRHPLPVPPPKPCHCHGRRCPRCSTCSNDMEDTQHRPVSNGVLISEENRTSEKWHERPHYWALSPFWKMNSIFVTCNSICKSALYSTALNADISAFAGSESQFGGH